VDKTGLVAFTTVGASRRVLLGFPEVAWDAKAPDYVTLANRALDWVEGKPVAYLRSWPWPARGAITLGVDALWRFENVPRPRAGALGRGREGLVPFPVVGSGRERAAIAISSPPGIPLAASVDTTQPFAGQSPAEAARARGAHVRGFRAVLGPQERT
jgi:hypothetical protein